MNAICFCPSFHLSLFLLIFSLPPSPFFISVILSPPFSPSPPPYLPLFFPLLLFFFFFFPRLSSSYFYSSSTPLFSLPSSFSSFVFPSFSSSSSSPIPSIFFILLYQISSFSSSFSLPLLLRLPSFLSLTLLPQHSPSTTPIGLTLRGNSPLHNLVISQALIPCCIMERNFPRFARDFVGIQEESSRRSIRF